MSLRVLIECTSDFGKKQTASPDVIYIMVTDIPRTGLGERSSMRTIRAPQAGDAIGCAFRAAYGVTDDLPPEFRRLLAGLDRAESSRH